MSGAGRGGDSGPRLGRLLVGTSGFAYRPWIGEFYPPGTRNEAMLGYYASRLGAVEINATFYRLPTEETLDQWTERTPSGFMFAFKASRRITHHSRLVDVGESVEFLLRRLSRLGERLGPVLFQCPPSLHLDLERLESFVKLLPPGAFAMEFRHPSWETAAVSELLAASGVALCLSDRDEAPISESVGRGSGALAYLRLRRSDYTAEQLGEWAERIRRTLESGSDVYAFLKHEDSAGGARWAEELRRLAA